MNVIGFTGSQKGMTRDQRRAILRHVAHDVESAVHGDCVGADAQFHDLCSYMEWRTNLRPCTIRAKRAFSAPIDGGWEAAAMEPLHRNRMIVAGCDFLIACPAEASEVTRSGTWATIRAARKKAAKTKAFRYVVIGPDGDVIETENYQPLVPEKGARQEEGA